MYSILQLRTSDSTAASTVTKCSQTQDGALAWRNLKEYFDQDGNKDVCEIKCRRELAQLRLDYNSPGGYDNYYSEFERICKQIEECGTTLPDREKRAHFLGGIHDPDYSAIKDICEQDDFASVVVRLARKAAELGKHNGPVRRHQKKITRRIRENRSPNNKSETNQHANSNIAGSQTRLPANVWSQMSPEVRKGYIEAIRKMRQGLTKPSFQKQYSSTTKPPTTRSINTNKAT